MHFNIEMLLLGLIDNLKFLKRWLVKNSFDI